MLKKYGLVENVICVSGVVIIVKLLSILGHFLNIIVKGKCRRRWEVLCTQSFAL